MCRVVFIALCSPRCGVKKRKKEKGGGDVLLSFFWPEPLIFLRAQRELGRRSLAYPGSFLVCAYHLHTFLEASLSLKPRLTDSPPESCWSSQPWIRTCGGGGRCGVVLKRPDEGEKMGGGKTEEMYRKKGQQFLCGENKREEEKKNCSQERERINESSVCGGALSPSLSPPLCACLARLLTLEPGSILC